MKRIIPFLIAALFLVACTVPTPAPVAEATAAPVQVPTRSAAPVGAPTGEPTEAPNQAAAGDPSKVTLTVLYTDDEHGWLEGVSANQSAAHLAGLWETADYDERGEVLILSGGDNFTGPAISSWFEGESMVEVMNAMGYDGSAIGNHEFDFGLDELAERIDQADFPYLSANMRYKTDGSVPVDLGILPYTLLEVAGLQVGLIGLTNTNTPTVTNPKIVEPFDFLDYAQVLNEVVPQVEAEGADMVFVITHICMGELTNLAGLVSDLGIDLFGGGHCHEEAARQAGGAVVLGGGESLATYAFASLSYDLTSGEVTLHDYGVERNRGGEPDPDVARVIEYWRGQTEEELTVPIGYLETFIGSRSSTMQALVTETWLWAFPEADVALTNLGGLRDSLQPGDVTIASVIGVLPFDNKIVRFELTGAQLIDVLDRAEVPAVGGLRYKGGQWIVKSTGEYIDPAATYTILTNDFMYAGGSGYTDLAAYDPDGYQTGLDWRQPVIDWILAQNSTAANPLDPAIEALK